MTDTPKKTTIIVNGKEVGPEAVPEFLRKFVEDANKNGIPDMMEHLLNNPMIKAVLGKAGSQLQNLTPEQKAKIEKLMTSLGGMVQGTPGASPAVSVTTVSTGDSASQPVSVFSSSSTDSGAARFRPASHNPQIDYKKMGIVDPEQKSSFPSLLIAALVGGILVLAAIVLFRGHL
ncbi:MAG TPA: hypothetical protein VFX30_00410 [bacterium]|nr:hypothetical protein [bacterium]